MANDMRYPADFVQSADGDWIVRFPGLEGAEAGSCAAVDCSQSGSLSDDAKDEDQQQRTGPPTAA